MRQDMAERFSEGKNQHKRKFPRRQKAVARLDEDGVPPCFVSMSKVHYAAKDWYYDKGYGSDYAIMRRFLRSNLGRPWDEVYSEICQQADTRTHDGHRLRECVDHIVEKSCTIDENGFLVNDKGIRLSKWYRWEYYVHPETKTLEYIQRRRKFVQPEIKTVYEMDGDHYLQHENIWYKVEMKLIPKERGNWGDCFIQPTMDAFDLHVGLPKCTKDRRFWGWNWMERYKKKYGYSPEMKPWYCASKKSANKRDIRKLKKKYEMEDEA
jgi:hypothetical protein